MKRRVTALALMVALSCVAVTQSSCTPDDVSKVKKKVADAAAILDTAAKSNRSLYQSGVYGAVGSPDAIAKRQQVATAIHQANEWLSMAVERAATLTAADLPSGKQNIVELLQKASAVLGTVHVSNQNIQLILTSAIAAINTAVTLTLAIKGVN
jgi:hypothetical protein